MIRYVGITTNITQRKSKHKKDKPSHEFEIIDIFTDKEEAGIAEQYHIAGHNTIIDGWNKSIGGELLLTGDKHPAWKGGIWSLNKETYMKEYRDKPENKARTKSYQKAYRQRPEQKAYMKEYNKAYRQRPEAKSKKKEYMKAYYARKKQQLLDL